MTQTFLIFAAALLLGSLAANAQESAKPSVSDDYQSPTFTLPYAHQKPTLDGTINDAEWRGALSVNALQTTRHQLSARATRFWMMWDEDNLYLAMRSPLRPGERLIQAERHLDKDYNVVYDDSYEIYLDAATNSPDGQPIYFQFLSNFAGSRWDVMHEPAVGNFRLGWTSGWQPKNRLNANGDWEMEVAIPRQSIYHDAPFADGEVLRGLVARNFKRPWEQNSVEGASSFSVRDTYSKWRLSKSAPALSLLDVADDKAKTLGLKISVSDSAATAATSPLTWMFESDGGAKKSGELAPGATVSELNLDKPGAGEKPGSYRIRVMRGKETLLDWSALRQFGVPEDAAPALDDKGDVANVALRFNPVHDYLRISGDFINYDDRARIASTKVSVADAAGKTIAEKDLKLDDLAYVQGVLQLPGLQPGAYKTTLTAFDAAGREVLTREEPFEKTDLTKFAWWNTTRGNIERVIKPWTPVQYQNGRIDVWGRAVRIGHAGLPAQIVSQNELLLARPMHLVATLADGKTLISTPAPFELVSRADNRVVGQSKSLLGDIAITTRVTVEFDGMIKVEMTLDPKKAVEIKALKVVMPLRNEVANYIHAAGEGIRSGYEFSFLDQTKSGQIWNSKRVDSQPMQRGSFIPYLWIGNPKAGLAWFADSDKGWIPSDETPAIELRRDSAQSTDLVMNLVSAQATLNEARTITFAVQATPTKPMPDGWRMNSWWAGDTFLDYAQVQPKGGNLIFSSLPFPLDMEKSKEMVQQRKKETNIFNFGVPLPANAVPYFEHIAIGTQFVPEMKIFGDEWETSVPRGLYYGKSFTDFMVDNLSKWSENAGIEGLYLDNVHPVADNNIEAGRGYVLPDGKIQPEYAMFSTREYFLRVRAAFQEQQGQSKFIIHMTNNMIIPWIGAGDVAFDGEHHVIYPTMKKDFMDFWSLERMRVDYSEQWGVPVNFMHEYQGDWDLKELAKAMRAYTGMVILHDALPSGNGNGMNTPVWIGRDRFGIGARDVQFVPYWDENSGAKSTAPDVLLAIWKRPGKVLVAVVNRGEATTAHVQIDAKKLGLPPAEKWKVWDAEHDTVINRTFMHSQLQEQVDLWKASSEGEIKQNGASVDVPVKRHDYRQFVIELAG